MDKCAYRWCVNFAASIVLVLIWKFAAWGLSIAPHWMSMGLTQDHWFMTIVAISLALHIPGRNTHSANTQASEKT